MRYANVPQKSNPKMRTQRAKQLYRISERSYNVAVNNEFLMLLRILVLGTWKNVVVT